jgi:hypothetical protein
MSSIERGAQNPGVMTVVAVARALGLSVSELVTIAGL